MSKPFSIDLRQRVVDFILAGNSCRAAARKFEVSAATAVRLHQRHKQTGSVAPSRQGRGYGHGKLEPVGDKIIDKVKVQPDITMLDLAGWLKKKHKVSIDPSNLSKFLIRKGITRKKKRFSQPNKPARMSVWNARPG